MAAPTSVVGSDSIEIRSFRVVFAIERRLHRVDRWRLPLPYGLPVRGLGYGAGTLLAVLVVGALPGLDVLVAALPAPIRYVAVPVLVAAVLARVRVDGRPAHRFVFTFTRHRLGPRWVDAFAPVPAAGSVHVITDPVLLADSLQADCYRPGRIHGPATVVLAQPARAQPHGHELRVTPAGGPPLRRGKRIALQAGQTLIIEAGAR